jgi:hypothetical protein
MATAVADDELDRPAPLDVEDRRRARRRHELEDHGIVGARVRPGQRVMVVNVSAGGALVETVHRLLPGTSVELFVQTDRCHLVIRGRVLRCAVSHLRASSVHYRGAIGFERHVVWLLEEQAHGYQVHPSEARGALGFRADDTPEVL